MDRQMKSAYISVGTSVLGGMILVSNLCIGCLIVKVFLSDVSYHEKYGLFVHLLFVTINDIACGLCLFLVGTVPVTSMSNAYTCAGLIFLSFSLQLTSQCNIACVCMQRFSLSKNGFSTKTRWKSVYTKCLFIVNISIGVAMFSALVTMSRLTYLPGSSSSTTCSWGTVLKYGGKASRILRYSFYIGVAFTVLGDLFCSLTFLRLRKTANLNIEEETRAPDRTRGGQPISELQISTRKRQKKATCTLFLIILFFNISALPYLCTLIMPKSVSRKISGEIYRILFATQFTNSLANPLIILTRIEEIRTAIKKVIRELWISIINICSKRQSEN